MRTNVAPNAIAQPIPQSLLKPRRESPWPPRSEGLYCGDPSRFRDQRRGTPHLLWVAKQFARWWCLSRLGPFYSPRLSPARETAAWTWVSPLKQLFQAGKTPRLEGDLP